MKKNIILIAVAVCVLICILTGCSGKINQDTVYNTQNVWNSTTEKQATDVITISDFNLAEILIINKAKFTFKRTFSDNKISVHFNLDEFDAEAIPDNVGPLIPIILANIPSDTKIELDINDLNEILSSIEELSGDLVLSENNTKLDYSIKLRIGYKSPEFNKTQTGSEIIDTNSAYSEVIKNCMDLFTSHYSSIFEPTTDGAKFNPSGISKIIKSAIEYAESVDPDKDSPDYVSINTKIKKIFGVGYNTLLTTKLKVNSSKSNCTVKNNFIKKMNVSLNRIKFLYNKKELIDALSKAVEYLSEDSNLGNATGMIKTILNNIIFETTPNVSCIEIGSINVNSTYILN